MVGSRLDDAGKMLHTLQTFVQGLTAKIEDQFTDAELTIAGDILNYLLGGPGEWPPFKSGMHLGRRYDIVQRRFQRNSHRRRVAPFGFDEALEVVQRRLQFVWTQGHRRIRADRMPAIAISRHTPQGWATVAANPQRRMRFLHRMRQTA